MTGSGYKKGTEKHMGNPTFLLYMNCPRVIDEFTVELPEERIDLNYHEINNLFPLISPVGTYCPCHRATQAGEKANPQGDIGKHLFPFFFGRRWYGRKKRCRGSKQTQHILNWVWQTRKEQLTAAYTFFPMLQEMNPYLKHDRCNAHAVLRL